MPQKELERLQAVHRFLKLEFNKQEELQEIVKMAAQICATPTCLITFIDENTQYIRFRQGFDFERSLRKDAFCSLVVEEGKMIVVPDTHVDQRFSGNPMVVGEPYIRFYVGVPLIALDGQILGSLCVIDQNPGMLTENQGEMLKILAKQIVQLIDFGESLRLLKEQYIEAKHSEIQLRSFFESSVDHHLLLGKDFEILAFNKAWENHVKNNYGFQLEEGKSMVNFIHPDHLVRFHEDYLTALNGAVIYEERNLRQHGKDHWRLVKFEPAYNSKGEIIGVSVNVADVNNKVQQEITVKLQNQRLHEIAFIQSHELRKPVASIMGLMSLIQMDGRYQDMEEWLMLEKAVNELDNKIRAILRTINEN